MSTFTELINTTFETLTCGECGVPFALTSAMQKNFLATGIRFYCPNGHGISYSDPENVKLRRELTAAKCETMRERNLREAVEFEKARVEKKLRRVKNGVCPECRRSFCNLARHMKTKHSK